MTDHTDPRQQALDRAAESIDLWKRLANSDLPIAPYARNLVRAVEEAEHDD